ncbi:hypothetical protein [Streptomyces sp. NPDC049881]|uniref:hypothetical protein n=1 Tax=Streptomyces sp. NPDC049881 TaxID=3155778 RepID=UPI0034248286
MSDTKPQEAVGATQPGKPVTKPQDDWITGEPVSAEAKPKTKPVKPLDDWITSEPAGEAQPGGKPVTKPQDDWITGEPVSVEAQPAGDGPK